MELEREMKTCYKDRLDDLISNILKLLQYLPGCSIQLIGNLSLQIGTKRRELFT